MIARLDSAYPPSPDTARAAAAAGVRGWDGYLSTAGYDGQSHFGLWHPWPREGFEFARLAGSTPIAYCSGQDDPVALKALAAAWNVRLCLDVEGGIRPDGPWVPGFLAASGAGLYGNYWVHPGRVAAFHVICASLGLGDPGTTWWVGKVPRPAGPCGYQWWNTHTEFGVSVDRGNFDDWFAGRFGGSTGSLEEEMDPEVLAQLIYVAALGRVAGALPAGSPSAGMPEEGWLVAAIKSAQAAQASGQSVDFVGLTVGAVTNSPEGQHWAALQKVIRGYTPDQLAAALKSAGGGSYDDSALKAQLASLQAEWTASQAELHKVEGAIKGAGAQLDQA